MKIAVGLSGGVDSSTAAYLLKEQGHEIEGITMKISGNETAHKGMKSACFGAGETEDIEEAGKICGLLKIPYHVADLSKGFNSYILKYFQDEYTAGRTPNPCMKCNQLLKFGLLFQEALKINKNFDHFATGHYANIGYDPGSGRYLLKKGIDEKKDQSYFLALLTQDQLSRIVLPLGRYTKGEIRNIAKKNGLSVHDKKESQDFYSGDYVDLIDSKMPEGSITGTDGKILGRHKGLYFYTIGQRKGLGISHSEPLYVLELDKSSNTVIVGTEEKLYRKEIIVSSPNWIAAENLTDKITANVKVRYAHKGASAMLEPLDTLGVKVTFEEPQKAIACGQYAVFYSGDSVIGGGVIENVLR